MNKETNQQQENENLSIEQKEKKARGEDIEPQRQVDKPTTQSDS
ncbi:MULTISPECIES: 3-methyladenine DNA glycosylase [Bacillaceae]|nr:MULTISPECIES: 3-methyladenine DNA glycosylase [Bacillus]